MVMSLNGNEKNQRANNHVNVTVRTEMCTSSAPPSYGAVLTKQILHLPLSRALSSRVKITDHSSMA